MGSLADRAQFCCDPTTPIAIVGIGFRGPGEANNLDGFFKLLSEAQGTRTAGQNGRWNHDAFYHSDAARKGSSNVKAGHHIKDDLSLFDASFFRMTESEAATLDPQQRLLLETCYEVLESGNMKRVAGSRTSAFVATFGADYTDLLQRDPDSMPYYQATSSGYSRAIILNRLSHFFDLRGPSVTVDTACSGGLAAVMPILEKGILFKPDATYLVAGGLGGIGRAIGLWMVGNGAMNLVFCGRSGASTPEAKEMVRTLREKGARVRAYACDIAEESEVHRMVERMRDEEKLPADYGAVVRPKVQGTLNLHSLVPGASSPDLDFFVMLSSVSGIIGNATQAAYAAANPFLDAFAAYRAGLGLYGAAVDLGAMEDVGYLAENPALLDAMRRQGFQTTTEDELLALLRDIVSRPKTPGVGRIGGHASQLVTCLGSWRPGASLGINLSAARFAHFRRLTGDTEAEGAAQGEGRLRERLRQPGGVYEAAAIICTAIVAKVAGVGRVSEDAVDPSRPLKEYGVDSLNAVEIRNWAFRKMDYTVSVLELMANQAIEKLATKIAQGSPLAAKVSGISGGFVNKLQIGLGVRSTQPLDAPQNRTVWKNDVRMAAYRNTEAVKGGAAGKSIGNSGLKEFLASTARDPAVFDADATADFLARKVGRTLYGFMLRDTGDEDIAALDVTQSLKDIGVDSLVGIELRNWFRQALSLEVTVLQMMEAPSLLALGARMAQMLKEKFTERAETNQEYLATKMP
ncbi:hypothetical protein QIS74_13034 [Colletotrichum tabaci]|uniref:Uncharacterized protein n=1 Tax=Colletotrichum tabaci TaxID=1209068 RepID=A0AAV9SWC0_9PEZI